MWAGLWQKRCKFPETATAIAYEQHGFFEQVSDGFKKKMKFIVIVKKMQRNLNWQLISRCCSNGYKYI